MYILADKREVLVPDQCTWEQTRFAENLEPIADTEDVSTSISKSNDLFHDRREPCDGSGAKVIPVGKAPWQDDHIERGWKTGVFVP
jgi:hypothetical protein